MNTTDKNALKQVEAVEKYMLENQNAKPISWNFIERTNDRIGLFVGKDKAFFNVILSKDGSFHVFISPAAQPSSLDFILDK